MIRYSSDIDLLTIPIQENVCVNELELLKAKQKESYLLARKELQNKTKKVKNYKYSFNNINPTNIYSIL